MKKVARTSAIALLLVLWLVAINLLIDLAENRGLSLTNEQKGPNKLDAGISSGVSPFLLAKGREIFEFTAGGVGCASCHGHFALGDINIGPDIRGFDEARIRGALANVEVMEFLAGQLTDDDIKAVAAFVRYLGAFTPAKSLRKSGSFTPAELHIPVDTQAQLIIENGDRTTCTFASADAGFAEKTIGGRKAEDVFWITPTAAATFTAACKEKPDELLTIIIDETQAVTGENSPSGSPVSPAGSDDE